MVGKVFDKFESAIKAMDQAIQEAFGSSRSISVVKQNDLTIAICDGNIEITGPHKELRINGKLVRFSKETKK